MEIITTKGVRFMQERKEKKKYKKKKNFKINIISYHTGTVNKKKLQTEFFRPCIGYYLINGMVMVCIERKKFTLVKF